MVLGSQSWGASASQLPSSAPYLPWLRPTDSHIPHKIISDQSDTYIFA